MIFNNIIISDAFKYMKISHLVNSTVESNDLFSDLISTVLLR